MPTSSGELREHIRATEAEIKALVARLNKVMSVSLRGVIAKLRAGGVSAETAGAMLAGFMGELKKAGLDDELKDVERLYAEELKFIKRRLSRLTDAQIFTNADRTTLETLINFDAARAAKTLERFGEDAKGVLMRHVLTGQEPDFATLDDKLTGRTLANLETELNTNIIAFSRTVTTSKAKDLGFNLMLYIGPDDKVTRPFCDDCLAGNAWGVTPRDVPIYTLDEIGQMDNEQGLPVLSYGGGYNCRHQWEVISDEDAAARGYKAE